MKPSKSFNFSEEIVMLVFIIKAVLELYINSSAIVLI